MAKKKQVGKRVEGWKAKSWYKVFAPEAFNKAYLGDTISGDPSTVVGRVFQTTLGELTNDFSRQHIKMKLRISNVAGDSAYTEYYGHEISRDYMRSLTKRRTSRIDCFVPFTTKDGKFIRITVTCFTLTNANLSQEHEIRKLLTQQTLQELKPFDLNGVYGEVLSGDLAKDLLKTAKEVFPVRRVEIIKSKFELPQTAQISS